MNISDLLAKRSKADVVIDDEVMVIEFRPNKMTAAEMVKLQQLAESAQKSGNYQEASDLELQILVDTIVTWELFENGSALPITLEVMRRLPIRLITAISEAIQESMTPKEMKSEPSSKGSF